MDKLCIFFFDILVYIWCKLLDIKVESWRTFHRKLYHPEFPCNPKEKLPICPFRAITPLELVLLRLLHAHYFKLMSSAAGGNLKQPVSGCQRQSMLGRYSWKSCAVKDQRKSFSSKFWSSISPTNEPALFALFPVKTLRCTLNATMSRAELHPGERKGGTH